MLEPGAVVEHRQGPTTRWLHERRVSLAIGVAIVEGVLIVAGELSKALALIVAIGLVVGYFTLRDRVTSDTVRQGFWVAAASQAIVVTVPIVVAITSVAALIVLALIGIAALLVLLGDRR